ncbi:hypothetical protein GCM10027073_68410 [Streptomyces chlorus]
MHQGEDLGRPGELTVTLHAGDPRVRVSGAGARIGRSAAPAGYAVVLLHAYREHDPGGPNGASCPGSRPSVAIVPARWRGAATRPALSHLAP